MKNVMSGLLLATAVTTSAFAADAMAPYAGASIGFGSVTDAATSYTGALPLKAHVGYAAKTGYGVEAELSLDMSSASATVFAQDVSISSTTYGVYATYGYFVPSAKVTVKARLGYLRGSQKFTNETYSITNTTSMGGLAYGVQVGYEVMPKVQAYVDYTSQGMVNENAVAFSMSSFSVGARYAF